MDNKEKITVKLSKGRSVDVTTQAGADAKIADNPLLVTECLKMVAPIRAKLTGASRIPASEARQLKSSLTWYYKVLGCVVLNSSNERFMLVPEEELVAWIDHLIEFFKKLTPTPEWTVTGALNEHDAMMVGTLAAFCSRWKFTKLSLFKTDLLARVAGWIAARSKPNMPATNISDIIVGVVMEAIYVCEKNNKDRVKIVNRLDDSGLLGQFIRCSTSPKLSPADVKAVCFVFDVLSTDLNRDKLKPQAPTGAILQDVLAGSDGHHGGVQKISNRLKEISTLWALSSFDGKTCANKSCYKVMRDNQILNCGACKAKAYCSKTCQREDWPSHKGSCKKSRGRAVRAARQYEDLESTVRSFICHYHYLLIKEVERITREEQVGLEDLVLVLDFRPDEKGNAPALQSPPEFEFMADRLSGEQKRTLAIADDGFRIRTYLAAGLTLNCSAVALTTKDMPTFSPTAIVVFRDALHRASLEGLRRVHEERDVKMLVQNMAADIAVQVRNGDRDIVDLNEFLESAEKLGMLDPVSQTKNGAGTPQE